MICQYFLKRRSKHRSTCQTAGHREKEGEWEKERERERDRKTDREEGENRAL